MQKLVIYNHGKDSIPWGEKPLALAEVAKECGWHFISPDYQITNNPDQRVQMLLNLNLAGYDLIVMVGSSMGAYVATVCAERIQVAGLFLLAPAFYLPGYGRTEFQPTTQNIEVIHGWQDEIVPPEHAWQFCKNHHANLQMLNADHRLLGELNLISQRFSDFLVKMTTTLN